MKEKSSGGTNIQKFEGLFVHQSFDCAHAHFEYGRGQIALTLEATWQILGRAVLVCARWNVQVMAVSNSATTSRSDVWKYISKDSSSASATCTLCEKVLAYRGGTIIHENATTKTNNSLLSTRLRRSVRTHRQKSSVNFLFD